MLNFEASMLGLRCICFWSVSIMSYVISKIFFAFVEANPLLDGGSQKLIVFRLYLMLQ